ncbi:hypothetical protein [Nannocystis sp. SCPEA4]|uniref:hypothetical protein n=1 Tax=Nannocystis sp. SCPEA4 TaxID=2996787 RepID=UPI00226F2502|nr:hypothetical protein [Nannocystis sp. SCPEA4]MCY1060897.1 hypothetical protein [Nannocystis sp. SCPEA4]
MESSTLETVMMVIGGLALAFSIFGPLLNHKKAQAEEAAYCQKVEQTLRELAEVVDGQFVAATYASKTLVVRNGMDVSVCIDHDSSPSDGVYTVISVALPPGRTWRKPRPRYRKEAPAGIDLTSSATFERYFTGARARDLTEDLRKRLLQLAQNDCLVQLYDREMLMFVSVPDPSTGRRTFLTDAQRLRSMIDAGALLAADLIAG